MRMAVVSAEKLKACLDLYDEDPFDEDKLTFFSL